MQVLVTVNNRSAIHKQLGNKTFHLIIDIDEDSTVQSISEALSKRIDVPDYCFKVILCGKVLANSTPIRNLLLGPQTSLSALVVDATENGSEGALQKTIIHNDASSFQVYCKPCGLVRRGKLRVYCSQCSSSSIILERDPAGWDDVLSLSKITGDCQDCGKEVFVQFCFKCVVCDEKALPFIHCRGTAGNSDCSICGEVIKDVIVDFGCHHNICMQCFIAYMNTSFNQQQFLLRPPHGYTLSCPVYNCNGCVTDPHHFYLLGEENYENYKKLAAEKFVTLQEDGIFCPNPKCGSAFIWDREPDQSKVRCPHCYCVFCSDCRLQKCICNEPDPTRATIETLCKKCPSCGAPTERNGGCTHIHCIHCNAHWCFLCVRPWSEECQWSHWFD